MKAMTSADARPSPLGELRASLADFAARCRAARWFGALFRVSVAQDIVRDVEEQHAEIAAEAFSAEQADLEAVKLLEQAARDGLPRADMVLVAKAIRLIRKSAEQDHEISEEAARA